MTMCNIKGVDCSVNYHQTLLYVVFYTNFTVQVTITAFITLLL